MKHDLFLELVRKDLVLYRSMTIGALVIGAVAVFMITRGPLMFYLGSIAAMCTFIIQTIFLVQFGVMMERKERVNQFVLSLPITGRQYVLAKITALSIACFVPFILTSGSALLLMYWNPASRGFIPFAITILLYFPLYFCVLISVTMSFRSDGPNVAVIIFFNIAINLLIAGLLNNASVQASIRGSEMIWPPLLTWVAGIEIAVTVVTLAAALLHQHRKTEFI